MEEWQISDHNVTLCTLLSDPQLPSLAMFPNTLCQGNDKKFTPYRELFNNPLNCEFYHNTTCPGYAGRTGNRTGRRLINFE